MIEPVAIEPIVKEVMVPVTPDVAFRRFTDELDAWWPRSTHSVSEETCASVHMEAREGGRLYEVDAQGREHVWGVVTSWKIDEQVGFTWHPGREPETAQEVTVSFCPVDGGTAVRLEHRGWERLGDAAQEVRDAYVDGWTWVLSLYSGSLETAQPVGRNPRASTADQER